MARLSWACPPMPRSLASNAKEAPMPERELELSQAHLAAIVESSDDAIISKDLDGTVRSFNASAERLFGYTAKEIIGQSITVLIPPERIHEENEILAKLRRGQKVDHYETIRLSK